MNSSRCLRFAAAFVLLAASLVAETSLMRALHENLLTPNTAAHPLGENVRGYTFTQGSSSGEYFWAKTLFSGTYRRKYGTGKDARMEVKEYKLELAARVTGQVRPDLYASVPYSQAYTPNPLFYPTVVPYADGSYPNGAALLKDYRHFAMSPGEIQETEKIRIGDRGVAFKMKYRKYRVHFVRGPVMFQVVFEVRGPAKEWFDNDDYTLPDDKANVLAEIESAHQQAYAAAIAEARQTAEIFNAWYQRNLPVKFPGPGLKGHYPLVDERSSSTQLYAALFKAEDAPPEMPIFVTDFAKDTRGNTQGIYNAIVEFRRKKTLTAADNANNLEAYRVKLSASFDLVDTSNVQQEWNTPIKSLDDAKKSYQQHLEKLDYGAKFYRGYFARNLASEPGQLIKLGLDKDATIDRTPLSLDGADEAAKGLVCWHDTPTYTVIARRGNLIVEVGGRDSLNNALVECERLAQLFLRRLATLKRPPAPAEDDPDEVRFYQVALTAAPDRVWPGESSTLRLDVRDEAGKPAAGAAFKLLSDGNALAEVRTDASGSATYVFKATGVYANTVSAESRSGKASVTINKGGMEITTAPSNGNAFGDGKTPLEFQVTLRDPRGQPVAGVNVTVTEPGNESGIRGQLSLAGGEPTTGKIEGTTDRDGRLRLRYLAPRLDAKEVKWERAHVVFATTATKSVPQLTERRDFFIVAGNEFVVTLAKPGFATNPVPLRLRTRNGQVRARFVTEPGVFPIGNAEVVVAGLDGKPVGRGMTDLNGAVELAFATDPLSGASQTEDIKEPIAVPLAPELLDRQQRAKPHLDRLKAQAFSTAAHERFWADLPKTLAAAPMAGRSLLAKKTRTADYWYNSATRLAFLALFVSELNERHVESRTWFLESFKQGIEALGTATALNDTLKEKAKETLGAGAKTEVWQQWNETALKKFIDGLMAQMKKALENLPDEIKELPDLKAGVEYAQKAVDWHEDPTKATGAGIDQGSEWLTEKLQSKVTDAVTTPWKKYVQKVLDESVALALANELPNQDWAPAEAQAKELFVAAEKQHNDLNLATCDQELYRLWAGLAKDTVGKGVAMYYGTVRQYTKGLTLAQVKELREGMTAEKLKELVGDPKEFFEKLQESMKGNADLVDRVASVFDTAYMTYRGYNWLSDAHRTHYTLEQIRRSLAPSPREGTAAGKSSP